MSIVSPELYVQMIATLAKKEDDLHQLAQRIQTINSALHSSDESNHFDEELRIIQATLRHNRAEYIQNVAKWNTIYNHLTSLPLRIAPELAIFMLNRMRAMVGDSPINYEDCVHNAALSLNIYSALLEKTKATTRDCNDLLKVLEAKSILPCQDGYRRLKR